MPSTARLPVVVPLGEWTLTRDRITFNSRPLAQPKTTVRFRWGDLDLVVRVEDRSDGMAHGHVLMSMRSNTRV